MSQSVEKSAVRVQARATNRSIKLRWAPDNPSLWKLANKYGYGIERIQMTANEKVLSQPRRLVLTSQPLKPALQKFWEPYVESDDYIAVAAQAIYGEHFALTSDQTSGMVSVINKARESESRFGFALFSADQSIRAATLSGLFYEDETIEPKAKYLYRIFANVPREILAVDTGYVFLGLDDYHPLPKPTDLHGDFGDHHVLLSWNGERHTKMYNSYWVERSVDNQHYQKITEKPIVNTFSGDKPKTRNVFRNDSLPENDVRYYYRVIGINAFGENSPPSDTISGRGRSMFAYAAAIREHEISSDGVVSLGWTFPDEGNSLLREFDLMRVDPKTRLSTTVVPNITKDVRTIRDPAPRSTNYYVIRARDKYGRTNNSFPYLVQLEDSVPPSAPMGLRGNIDTTGLVFLEWQPNKEEDLLGYTIHRANFQSDEFIQIPGVITKNNSYVDTIRLDNLTETIYYRVSAMDRRFNPSRFSELLQLQKPDKIPPVAAVFKSIKCDSLGVLIGWEFSSSEDVTQHLLYRKETGEHEWTLIRILAAADTVRSFLDEKVQHRRQYHYTMVAVDDNGLESTPASPVSVTFIRREPFPPVAELFYKVDREKKTITISWKYTTEGVDHFSIYKSVNDQPVKLYTSLSGATREWQDAYRLNDASVEYRIVAQFPTGEKTRMSRPIVIKF